MSKPSKPETPKRRSRRRERLTLPLDRARVAVWNARKPNESFDDALNRYVRLGMKVTRK